MDVPRGAGIRRLVYKRMNRKEVPTNAPGQEFLYLKSGGAQCRIKLPPWQAAYNCIRKKHLAAKVLFIAYNRKYMVLYNVKLKYKLW